MNFTACGKTIQNLRNRIKLKLTSNQKDCLKLTSKLYVTKIFDNHLVAIHKNKVTLTLNKPAYTGMCISELSNVLIYEFTMIILKNKYSNNPRLLFTDTDSFMYVIKIEDVYENFSNNKEMFDFSNYSTKSKYCDNSNKLVVGKMKDETARVTIGTLLD